MEKDTQSFKMGNSSSVEDSWSRTFEKIKHAHDFAYTLIEEAITLEEQEKPHEAIEKYKEGILQIDKALNIQVTCPENPGITWEKATVMIQKLKKTRAEVLTRIHSIQCAKDFVPVAPPPSYDEAVASTSSSLGSNSPPQTYTELASALSSLQVESGRHGDYTVVYAYDGVRLYLISPDGQVLSSSDPQSLIIGVYDGETEKKTSAFLQVGTWVYPLVPGVSPCYRTDYGAFIFPDVHSEQPGSSVGLILPKEIDTEVYEILENILHGIVTQTGGLDRKAIGEAVEEEPEKPLADKISTGLINGAATISQGLIKGAFKTAEFINYGTPKVMSKLSPVHEAKPVNRKVAKTLKIAETATSNAAHVTGVVAGAVGTATMKLGRFLAPHIQKQGTRLLTTGFNYSEEEASSKVNQILTVAASAVEGFSTVYSGLETSATILGRNLSENTVKIVNHKYGGPAGEVTRDTLSTVGNVYNVNQNLKVMTPKGFVRKTVADAGIAAGGSCAVRESRVSLRSSCEVVKVNGGSNEKSDPKD